MNFKTRRLKIYLFVNECLPLNVLYLQTHNGQFSWSASRGIQQGCPWPLWPFRLLWEERCSPWPGKHYWQFMFIPVCVLINFVFRWSCRRFLPGSPDETWPLLLLEGPFLVLTGGCISIPIGFKITIPFIRWNFKYCLPKHCGLTPFVQVQHRIKYKWHASFRVTQLIYV